MKNKLYKNALVASVTLAFSIGVNAQTGGNTSFGTIASVNAGSSVQVRGSFTGDPDSCGDTDAYILESTDPNFRNLYAGLLTALASGSEARLFVVGCVANTPGTRNRPSIKSITVSSQ